MTKSKSKSFLENISKFGIIAIFVIAIFGCWSYFQAEILTYTSNIDGTAICGDAGLSYFKITNYDGIVGRAEMICVRKNTDESTFLKINLVKTDYGRKQNWEIIYTEKIYNDSGLIWPIYL